MGISIRDEMIQFYNKYYSAHRMCLCLLSDAPLSTLKEMAISKFSSVPLLQDDSPYQTVQNLGTSTSAFAPSVKKFYKIVPVKDMHALYCYFPMFPYQIDHNLYKKKPMKYVAHLLGHEAKGSLFSYLKKQGWVVSLSTGISYSFMDQAVFSIDVRMTEQGEDHVQDIIRLLYLYIHRAFVCKKTSENPSGIQKWIYDELATISQVSFRFSEHSSDVGDTVSTNAHRLQRYDPENILSGGSMLWHERYDPEIISNYFSRFEPNNMLVFWASKRFANEDSGSEPVFGTEPLKLETEQWYSTHYYEEAIPESQIKEWKQVLDYGGEEASLFDLPLPNPFIPQQFEIKATPDQVAADPKVVCNMGHFEVWFKQDLTFKQPKVNIFLEWILPETYASPLNLLMVRVFTDLVEDSLNEVAYDASTAHCSYDIAPTVYGISVELSGYNDTLLTLLEKVIVNGIVKFDAAEDRFDIVRERLKREYKNASKEQPYVFGSTKLLSAMYQNKYHQEDYLAVLPYLNYARFRNFVKFSIQQCMQTKVNSFFHGNITEQEVIQTATWLNDHMFVSRPIIGHHLLSSINWKRVVQLEAGKDFVLQIPTANEKDVNSSLQVLYQIDIESNVRAEAMLLLFTQLVSPAFYTQLRTKEQLGYIVYAKDRIDNALLTFVSVIQSDHAHPEQLLKRHDAFYYTQWVEHMLTCSELEIQKSASSLVKLCREKDKKLRSESIRLWDQIRNKSFQFDQSEQIAQVLEKVTKMDVVHFFETYFAMRNARRIIVQVLSKKQQQVVNTEEPVSNIRSRMTTSNPFDIKHTQAFFPLQ